MAAVAWQGRGEGGGRGSRDAGGRDLIPHILPIHPLIFPVHPAAHACPAPPAAAAGKGKAAAEEAEGAGAGEKKPFEGDDGIALATMDIFAGVGGLSEGMHQAGAWGLLQNAPCWRAVRLC